MLAGKHPVTGKVSENIEEEYAQAFSNINDVVLGALNQDGRVTEDGKTGWDYIVKLQTYHVGLSTMQDKARELMVQNIKKWCPNHQPLFTMVGVESLPFSELHIEIEGFALVELKKQ